MCGLCSNARETFTKIRKKKIEKKSDLPTLIFFLCYANQTIFFFRPYSVKNVEIVHNHANFKLWV